VTSPSAPDAPSDDVRDEARRAVEAIVLVSEQPVETNLLGQLLELRPTIVEELCRELAAEYEAEGRGFQLARVAGGWRFQTHPDQAPYVERFVLEGQTAKLSAAALETLAIVAYKQPVSRAQVASIRGVSVDGVMRTLQQRGYIAEIGRDPGPGQATMFGTTRAFLTKLGVDSLSDLPALGDFVPGADVVEQLERGLRPDGPSVPPAAEAMDAADLVDSDDDVMDAREPMDAGDLRDDDGLVDAGEPMDAGDLVDAHDDVVDAGGPVDAGEGLGGPVLDLPAVGPPPERDGDG
jgi:segregation and condensation protein B